MIRINHQLLKDTSLKAQQSPRRRTNHNFHKHPSARVQRMLNAMEPDTYVRPHKHETPDKLEVFFCLKGSFAVVIFDDSGRITDVEILDPEKGRYGVEIAPRTWHSLVTLAPGSVAYEVKDGPYDAADDKKFAPWSPDEGSPEAAAWLESLTKSIFRFSTESNTGRSATE